MGPDEGGSRPPGTAPAPAPGASSQGQAASPKLIHRGVLREVARASDSYGLVLFLVAVDYLLLSVPWEGWLQVIVSTLFICATALLAFHTSHVRGRWLLAVRWASGIAVLASIGSALADRRQATGVTFAIVALLILVTPVAILQRIVRHRRVTVETLLGAISVYVLIGIVFAYADYALQLVSGVSFFAQSGHFNEQDFVYYSFITMTTVGYGDLTPANGLPRTFAVLDALTGQIFLVVLVSRLVALYTPRASGERRRMLAAGRPGAVDDVEDVEDPEMLDPGLDGSLDEEGPEPVPT